MKRQKRVKRAKSCRLSSACFGCRPAFCQVCLYRYRLEEVVSTEADTVSLYISIPITGNTSFLQYSIILVALLLSYATLCIPIAWRKLTKGVESLLLGCTRQYVYKLVEQGKLPTSRLLEATGQQAYYRHVGGIVIVEELAEPLQPSSLAVVHRQQRHRQPACQVDHAVGGTVEDEKGDGIE